MSMIEKSKVQALVEGLIAEELQHLYIVEVAVHPGPRISIELGSTQGVGIDECVRINKHIEANLDREVEDYELEVGSAGITSPFKVLRQWTDAVGAEVELLRKGGVKEVGTLVDATESEAKLLVVRRIKPEGAKRKQDVEQEIVIPMDEVLQCKRIITF